MQTLKIKRAQKKAYKIYSVRKAGGALVHYGFLSSYQAKKFITLQTNRDELYVVREQ